MSLTAKKMSLKQKLNLARKGKLPAPDTTPAIKPKEPVPVYYIKVEKKKDVILQDVGGNDPGAERPAAVLQGPCGNAGPDAGVRIPSPAELAAWRSQRGKANSQDELCDADTEKPE